MTSLLKFVEERRAELDREEQDHILQRPDELMDHSLETLHQTEQDLKSLPIDKAAMVIARPTKAAMIYTGTYGGGASPEEAALLRQVHEADRLRKQAESTGVGWERLQAVFNKR